MDVINGFMDIFIRHEEVQKLIGEFVVVLFSEGFSL
jgi:hypothetical protein